MARPGCLLLLRWQSLEQATCFTRKDLIPDMMVSPFSSAGFEWKKHWRRRLPAAAEALPA
jgi:hypothetical protein